MVRTLRRDLSRYNAEEKEELQEESGWKLVHADVLRPPPLPLLLSSTVGTGMQLLGMSCISIFCAMIGFLSPANRGGLLTATLLLFVLMGVPAGYFASRTCVPTKLTTGLRTLSRHMLRLCVQTIPLCDCHLLHLNLYHCT